MHGMENIRHAQACYILLAERLSTFLNSGFSEKTSGIEEEPKSSSESGNLSNIDSDVSTNWISI